MTVIDGGERAASVQDRAMVRRTAGARVLRASAARVGGGRTRVVRSARGLTAVGTLLALLAVSAPVAGKQPRPVDRRRVALRSPRRGSSQVSPKTAITLVVSGFFGKAADLVKQLQQQLVLTDLASGRSSGSAPAPS